MLTASGRDSEYQAAPVGEVSPFENLYDSQECNVGASTTIMFLYHRTSLT